MTANSHDKHVIIKIGCFICGFLFMGFGLGPIFMMLFKEYSPNDPYFYYMCFWSLLFSLIGAILMREVFVKKEKKEEAKR